MTSWVAFIFSGAYLLGLLATGITEARLLSSISVVGIGMLCLGGLASTLVPRRWRMGPTKYQWRIAGVFGLVAASYCVAMSPQPGAIDVSRVVDDQELWVNG